MKTAFKKFKSLLKKTIRKFASQIKIYCSDTVHVSIGENCLTDNILQRHNIKSFTTPYSHVRSNLDYAIKLEKENYKNLLNIQHLHYEQLHGKPVVINNHGFSSDPIFLELHRNGFEFHFHDVISNKSHRESVRRKIHRLVSLKGKKNFVFYYHYRMNKNLNFPNFIAKAKTFLSHYEVNGCKCRMVIFTQKLCTSEARRGYRIIRHSEKIQLIVFNTLKSWGGDVADFYWARVDDDLIREAFMEVHIQNNRDQKDTRNRRSACT